MIKVSDLKIPLIYDSKTLEEIVAHRLRIEPSRIEQINILKRSVNVTDKQDICFNMSVEVSISGDENEVIRKSRDKKITKEIPSVYIMPERKKLKKRPVIVGCGPAGLFAALILAQADAAPILIERGCDVDNRKQSVIKFWQTGLLDINSNVQFGEGGAGAFSDGKLKIGFPDARKKMILSEFVEAGAPEEIIFLGKPHIGTDRLHEAVKAIRKKIISYGGEVRFNTTLTDILRNDGHVTGVGFKEKDIYSEIETDNVVLAIGHSARDTFNRLYDSGVCMEQKSFAIGVRIEHAQEMINKIQYGKFAGHPALGAADYRMVVHLKSGRNVYTFCMCPGGTVVAAAFQRKTEW